MTFTKVDISSLNACATQSSKIPATGDSLAEQGYLEAHGNDSAGFHLAPPKTLKSATLSNPKQFCFCKFSLPLPVGHLSPYASIAGWPLDPFDPPASDTILGGALGNLSNHSFMLTRW